MIKLLAKIFFILFVSFLIIPFSASAQEKIEVNLFYSETCPHCIQENKFLDGLQKKYSYLEIKRYSVFKKENVDLLETFYKEHEVPEKYFGLTPITFIDKKIFFGFSDQIGQSIEEYILNLEKGNFSPEELEKITSWTNLRETVSLPFLGKIKVANLPPLALSIVLGTLDGFNACAIVALCFLLTALISTGTRKKVIIVGGAFILTSGLVYFLFIAAWLNLFLLLHYVKIITIIIGLITIAVAIFSLKDYFKGIICKICHISLEKEGIFTRIQKKLFGKFSQLLVAKTPLLPLLLGVIIIAAGINMVELFCSLGFPLAFTKVLAAANLSSASYYFYLLLYIFFYILIDIIIFLIAIITFRTVKNLDKHLAVVKLISGILLLLLGLTMLIKPGLLMLN